MEITAENNVMYGGLSIDDRGIVRYVNAFDFSGVKRFYQVENHRRGFIRAWHGHRSEGKYIYVARGSALIGVVSLEGRSIDVFKFVLSAALPRVLWVPPGHFNGAMTLEEDTIILYFSTATTEESKEDDIRKPYNAWNIWEEDFR